MSALDKILSQERKYIEAQKQADINYVRTVAPQLAGNVEAQTAKYQQSLHKTKQYDEAIKRSIEQEAWFKDSWLGFIKKYNKDRAKDKKIVLKKGDKLDKDIVEEVKKYGPEEMSEWLKEYGKVFEPKLPRTEEDIRTELIPTIGHTLSKILIKPIKADKVSLIGQVEAVNRLRNITVGGVVGERWARHARDTKSIEEAGIELYNKCGQPRPEKGFFTKDKDIAKWWRGEGEYGVRDEAFFRLMNGKNSALDTILNKRSK